MLFFFFKGKRKTETENVLRSDLPDVQEIPSFPLMSVRTM